MSSPYIIISYLRFSCIFFWFVLHRILFYFISNWFNSILFDSVVLHSILCLFVRPSVHLLSVCLSVYLFICMNKFLFSLLFSFLSFLYLISFLFLMTFFFHEHLPCTFTCTCTHADTHMHMNICSFLWLVHITSEVGKWRIVF